MNLIKEFKEFAIKGNMMDMAVGIIIGAAFGKIISSLVADVLMPPLGVLIGGVDFAGLTVTLKDATATAPAVVLAYGKFIQATIDFLIVALAIFGAVKVINTLKKQDKASPAPALSTQETLLKEIRDILKKDLRAAVE